MSKYKAIVPNVALAGLLAGMSGNAEAIVERSNCRFSFNTSAPDNRGFVDNFLNLEGDCTTSLEVSINAPPPPVEGPNFSHVKSITFNGKGHTITAEDRFFPDAVGGGLRERNSPARRRLGLPPSDLPHGLDLPHRKGKPALASPFPKSSGNFNRQVVPVAVPSARPRTPSAPRRSSG